MLIYLLLLAAVIAVGCFTDLFDFKELGAVFTVNMTSLLKLVIMVLVILLAANIIIFVLGCIKPRSHRGGSILSLLASLVKYVAGIIIVCQSLSLLGVNVGTIIASVGVLALVVGFSAESLIADVVIGAFMLLENQYNVGDIVEVNGFRGVVTRIGIRTTSITDGGGNVKIINNSEMKNILNRSDNNSWSVSDISIPYETDLAQLESRLPALLEEIRAARSDVMLDAPQYLGVQSLDASGVVLRFWVKVAEKDIYAGIHPAAGAAPAGHGAARRKGRGGRCPPGQGRQVEEAGLHSGGRLCTDRLPPAGCSRRRSTGRRTRHRRHTRRLRGIRRRPAALHHI